VARLVAVPASPVAETREQPTKAAVTLPSAFFVALAWSRNSRIAHLPLAFSSGIDEPSRHFIMTLSSPQVGK